MQGHSGPQLLQLLTVDGEGAGTGGQGHATHQAALTGFSQPVPELRGSFSDVDPTSGTSQALAISQ